MKHYDAVVIYTPESEKLTSAKEEVTDQFKESGIKVVKEEDLGEKNLAYEVKKNNRGRYFLYEVEADIDKLKPVESAFKLKPEILKFVVFRK